MPFVEGLVDTLEQFGITDLERKGLELKEHLRLEHDINIIIGLIDDLEGNIGLSMTSKTSLAIVSAMMGGMEVTELDDLAWSALSELSNMVAAAATIKLSNLSIGVDITPPTLVMGEDLLMIISQVQTVSVDIHSGLGSMQINVGLERIKG